MMLVIILLFIGIVIYKARIMNADYAKEALDYRNTLSIRGICAIEIVLGHIGIALPNQLLLFPFRKAGILIVGIFFFLSGYGLMYSLENKKDYLVGFLKKRITAILLPVFLVCIFTMLIYSIILDNNNSIIGLALNSIKSINWYVWEIFGCYILFYLAYKFAEKKTAFKIVVIICSLFICISYVTGLSNPWYGSTLCFPLGLWAMQNKEKFLEWSTVRWMRKAIVLGIILGISIILFFILPGRSIIGAIVSRNIASLSFCCLAVILLRKVKLGNRISSFLGEISFEIYLIHPVIIYFFHSSQVYIENDIVYTIVTIMTSILLAALLRQNVHKIKSK